MEVFAPFSLWEWLPWISGMFVLLWIIHLRVKNASLADVGFCVVFGLLVLACGMSHPGEPIRRACITGMGLLYAGRLGSHLFRHRVWKTIEDLRYQRIRTKLGAWESVGMFLYFQVQGPACLFFAGLLCWVMNHPAQSIRWWDILGVLVFLVAIIGEAVADRQLESFRYKPLNKGQTLQAGLWRYSRHPNYFFECLHWWAYVPLAFGLSWGWASIVWPILMMISLLWITGVPLAEAQAHASRGEGYHDYQRTTNKFFPWFPRKVKSKSQSSSMGKS